MDTLATVVSNKREILTKDNILVWLDEENRITALWLQNGLHSLKVFGKEEDLEDIYEFVRKNEYKVCSNCLKKVEEFAGKHFAGWYCKECWEEYKKKYSRVCITCNKPEYECTC